MQFLYFLDFQINPRLKMKKRYKRSLFIKIQETSAFIQIKSINCGGTIQNTSLYTWHSSYLENPNAEKKRTLSSINSKSVKRCFKRPKVNHRHEN